MRSRGVRCLWVGAVSQLRASRDSLAWGRGVAWCAGRCASRTLPRALPVMSFPRAAYMTPASPLLTVPVTGGADPLVPNFLRDVGGVVHPLEGTHGTQGSSRPLECRAVPAVRQECKYRYWLRLIERSCPGFPNSPARIVSYRVVDLYTHTLPDIPLALGKTRTYVW